MHCYACLRDRAAERVRLEHGLLGRTLRRVATIGSFGLYRPKADSPDSLERYALTRSMRTHVSLLEEVAATPHPIDVAWAPEKYRESLDFVLAHGELSPPDLAPVLASIVRGSDDVETQVIALESLARNEFAVTSKRRSNVAWAATKIREWEKTLARTKPEVEDLLFWATYSPEMEETAVARAPGE